MRDVRYQLVVWSDEYKRVVNPPMLTHPFYADWSALNYATWWLEVNPRDVVMLVEREQAYCKHCNGHILEKMGWIVHKWVHSKTGAHLCFGQVHTQAEPKEEG